MLDGLGGAELLHQEDATLHALPTLLGDAIDCPTRGGADVIVSEDSCAWLGVGQSWGRYSCCLLVAVTAFEVVAGMPRA